MTKNIGYHAESVACLYLKNKEYIILARNIIFYNTEIDILCKRWDANFNEYVYYFFEVKKIQISNQKSGYPSISKNQKKRYIQSISKWTYAKNKLYSTVIGLILIYNTNKVEEIILNE